MCRNLLVRGCSADEFLPSHQESLGHLCDTDYKPTGTALREAYAGSPGEGTTHLCLEQLHDRP